ncbi:MAG: hypothetical protein ACKOCM_01150 [Cyanobacteriota bacterium]
MSSGPQKQTKQQETKQQETERQETERREKKQEKIAPSGSEGRSIEVLNQGLIRNHALDAPPSRCRSRNQRAVRPLAPHSFGRIGTSGAKEGRVIDSRTFDSRTFNSSGIDSRIINNRVTDNRGIKKTPLKRALPGPMDHLVDKADLTPSPLKGQAATGAA